MPQELQVVRCYLCNRFQVKIVTKVLKWSCSMCGNHQSLKQVFFRGSGKECRKFVQGVNYRFGAETEQMLVSLVEKNVNAECIEKINDCTPSNRESKWEKYLDKPAPLKLEDNPEVENQYTFERMSRKRKRSTDINNCNPNDSKSELKSTLLAEQCVEEITIKNYEIQSTNHIESPVLDLSTSKWSKFINNNT